MALPAFVLRKLYRRGSLRQVGAGHFAFVLQNPLGTATLLEPPLIVVNGIRYDADDIEPTPLEHSPDVDLDRVAPDHPFRFERGMAYDLRMPGRLMRAGNRIHLEVLTREWGTIDVLFEDAEQDVCEMHGGEEE